MWATSEFGWWLVGSCWLSVNVPGCEPAGCGVESAVTLDVRNSLEFVHFGAPVNGHVQVWAVPSTTLREQIIGSYVECECIWVDVNVQLFHGGSILVVGIVIK